MAGLEASVFLWFYKRLVAWFKIIVVPSLLKLIRARFGLTSQDPFTTMPSIQIRRNNNMKKYIRPIAAALCFGTFVLVTPTSFAQTKAAKLEAIAQQLNLTPQQKVKVLPILADEAPKIQAIKNDNSLSKIQKIQRLKALQEPQETPH